MCFLLIFPSLTFIYIVYFLRGSDCKNSMKKNKKKTLGLRIKYLTNLKVFVGGLLNENKKSIEKRDENRGEVSGEV